jgi:hypothetical protein
MTSERINSNRTASKRLTSKRVKLTYNACTYKFLTFKNTECITSERICSIQLFTLVKNFHKLTLDTYSEKSVLFFSLVVGVYFRNK